MRVMFVARAVDRIAGGVERMIFTLMDAFATRDHEVCLLTWDHAGAEAFYPMISRITWHRLDMGDPQLRASPMLMLRRAHKVRSVVRRWKPDVMICFQDGPFIAMRGYTLGLHIPIVAAERNAPHRFDHISAGSYRVLIYQSLRFAARIAIQCESYRELYPSYLQRRIVCIPNPVLPAAISAEPDVPGPRDRFRLLSVGRLGFQKNYPVLIEAFARLAPKFPDWDLAIVGEGNDRPALERLIRARDLCDRVELPGASSSVEQWYASSHLFCLPSRWEGFPNALAEALAHGLPPVAFAECAGMRDLITHGRCGLLAEGNGDLGSLETVLEKAMSSSALRRSLGMEAVQSVRRFDPSKVFSAWEQLLLDVTHGLRPAFLKPKGILGIS